jgi:hypothetical protein
MDYLALSLPENDLGFAVQDDLKGPFAMIDPERDNRHAVGIKAKGLRP